VLETFFDVIVPVIAIVIFYLFTPALVFTGLATIELEGGTVARLAACSVGVFVINAAIALVWAKLRGLEAAQRATVAIASAVPNQGNMGLNAALLLFGV
jgi:predicted permease